MKINDAYVRIWRGYRYYAYTAYVRRSGYELVGATKMANPEEGISEMFHRRGESIMEHSAKVAYLCSAFVSHFPEALSVDFPCDGESWSEATWLLMTTALLHDVGEVATGDIPDDGNPHHDVKDELERDAFENHMAGAFAREDFLPLRKSYLDFQNHQGVGQLVFALDKLEAILFLLWLEDSAEIYGKVTAKPLPTEQDMHYAQLIGTPCATDCWAAHTKDRFKELPDNLTEHIYGILRTATLEVRGEWFDWWDEV